MSTYVVHDFAGHPFQAELSRELARRGHRVAHAFCGGVTTGQGDLVRSGDDPPGLEFVDVSSQPFERYGLVGRLRSEFLYGLRLARLIRQRRPEVLICANTPLLPLGLAWLAARSCRARRILWLQDFLGRGVRAVLAARGRWLGSSLGSLFERAERRLLRSSDAIVVISPDFVEVLAELSVDVPTVVIENWAPLDELAPRRVHPRPSFLAELSTERIVLYAGTLGLKHDPEHLVRLAESLDASEVALVVLSEGRGREYLERAKAERGLPALTLGDFVPYSDLSTVLASADVCLVLLESEAGAFSVPSKVLTYLAAGRAMVGAIPERNLAARTIVEAEAGVVVRPGDYDGFCRAVMQLCADAGRRSAAEDAALEFARARFAIGPIADRFEMVCGTTEAETGTT